MFRGSIRSMRPVSGRWCHVRAPVVGLILYIVLQKLLLVRRDRLRDHARGPPASRCTYHQSSSVGIVVSVFIAPFYAALFNVTPTSTSGVPQSGLEPRPCCVGLDPGGGWGGRRSRLLSSQPLSYAAPAKPGAPSITASVLRASRLTELPRVQASTLLFVASYLRLGPSVRSAPHDDPPS